MVKDDIVQVAAEARFADSCSMSRKEELSTETTELLSVVDSSNSVIIIIKDLKDFRHRYRVKLTTALDVVMDDFKRRTGEPHMFFLYNGHKVQNFHTPRGVGVNRSQPVRSSAWLIHRSCLRTRNCRRTSLTSS